MYLKLSHCLLFAMMPFFGLSKSMEKIYQESCDNSKVTQIMEVAKEAYLYG